VFTVIIVDKRQFPERVCGLCRFQDLSGGVRPAVCVCVCVVSRQINTRLLIYCSVMNMIIRTASVHSLSYPSDSFVRGQIIVLLVKLSGYWSNNYNVFDFFSL